MSTYCSILSSTKYRHLQWQKSQFAEFAGKFTAGLKTGLREEAILSSVSLHCPARVGIFRTVENWDLWKERYSHECTRINPLNTELNPTCYLLALLGAHHFLHVSRIRVKLLTFRLLMSYIYIYIYGEPILDVSRSHTTTQHSR